MYVFYTILNRLFKYFRNNFFFLSFRSQKIKNDSFFSKKKPPIDFSAQQSLALSHPLFCAHRGEGVS